MRAINSITADSANSRVGWSPDRCIETLRRIFGSAATSLRQPMRLALLADLFPIGVIAVLQPARGIAADGLQMRGRIGRIAHFLIGRRHRHRVQALDGAGMADRRAVGADE